MKKWRVACIGGPWDGTVLKAAWIGARLITNPMIEADGMWFHVYDYTGIVRRTAFARYAGKTR